MIWYLVNFRVGEINTILFDFLSTRTLYILIVANSP